MHSTELRDQSPGLPRVLPAISGTMEMSDNHAPVSGFRVLDVPRLETLGEETGLGVRGVATQYLEQVDD